MKSTAAAIASIALLSLFQHTQALAIDQNQEVEISVDTLLVPERGYDDNDFVQVTLQGYLPNGCYILGRYELESSASELRIRQFAIESGAGICDRPQTIPPHLAVPVPFTTEITLGQIEVGQYQLKYLRPNGQTALHALEVKRAPVPQIDSLSYAAVTNVIADDFVGENTQITATVTGILHSTCTEFDTVQLAEIGETVVVLPLLKIQKNIPCQPDRRNFSYKIALGKMSVGPHLLHVRSMSGRAITRVVEVIRERNR